MVSKNLKTLNLLHKLNGYVVLNQQNDETVGMYRFRLRRIVSDAVNITDRHTITGWINLLLGKHYINPNPTSEWQKVKESYNTRSRFMPNNETRYFLNHKVIRYEILRLQKTLKIKTHHPHLTLDKYSVKSAMELKQSGKQMPQRK